MGKQAALNWILVAAFFAFVGAAYAGVAMHHGSDFDLGSFVQWVAALGLGLSGAGILLVCISERGGV